MHALNRLPVHADRNLVLGNFISSVVDSELSRQILQQKQSVFLRGSRI